MHKPVAEIRDVFKSYRLDAVEVPVLTGVNLMVRRGVFTVLLGPSGSGKTTLLNLVGCIDRPDSGEVRVAGRAVTRYGDDRLSDFRAKHIGYIFQNFNLIPVLTAYENIEYPLLLAGWAPERRARRVNALLRHVQLEDRARNLPGQLSGGQRQRVAVARALARGPRLVICDEPTANLDSATGADIVRLMRRMQLAFGISFLFSSHDRSLLTIADDVIHLRDGVIHGIERRAEVKATPDPEFADTESPHEHEEAVEGLEVTELDEPL
jgi:putative ABC transport system ATP-binding protein